MESGFMSWFDAPVKYSVICLCAYLVFITAMPKRESHGRYVIGGFLSLLPALFMTLFRDFLIPFHIVSMVAVFMLVILFIFRLRPKDIFTLSMISFGFSYAAFFISTMLVIFCGVEYCNIAFGDYTRSDIFFESALVHVVTVFIMQIIYIAIICTLLKSKRLRNGLANIVRFGMSDVGIYISVIIMLSTTLFGVFHKIHIIGTTSTVIWFVLAACIVLMGFWVKREIKAVYIRKAMADEAEFLTECILEKEKTIAALREDNDRLSALIHKDNKLIPAMVMSVRELANDTRSRTDSDSVDSAEKALEIAEQLDGIYRERSAAVAAYEARGRALPSTGAVSVDAMLSYMARKASENGVEFGVNVSTDLKGVLDSAIDRHEFTTILADLTDNALISAAAAKVKAVSVSIGRQDGSLFLSVSDSGAKFENAVLKHMGLKKVTTHSESGGSGTGLMTLFSILKRYNASLIIEEAPSDSVFTKSVTVSFDGTGRLIKG